MAKANISPELISNRLLASLPPRVCNRLLQNMERVSLGLNEILYRSWESVDYVYFPNQGVLSLVQVISGGASAEVAIVGNEGLVDVAAFMGDGRTPHQIIVQVPADMIRIESEALRREFRRSGILQELVMSYTQALYMQISQTAVCNRFHKIENRLARWLLMTRDHVETDRFDMTQEFLAHMLGGPRSGVTLSAIALQDAKLISYSRGKLSIIDRDGLESSACECYRKVRDVYNNYLNKLKARHSS